MIAFAAALTGLATYLAVGALTGAGPTLRLPRSGVGSAASTRQTWLTQAGAELTPRQFWVGSALVGALTFAVVLVATATPAVAVVPAVTVGFLPRAWFARRRALRLREVVEAWPDGLRDLIASISAGLSLHQGVLALVEHGPAPLRQAFGRYPVLAPVLGVVPALEVVQEELADPTSDRVIEVLILAHERGGHILVDILGDLATATTRDVRALEEIATEQLEQRINARAVFVLPWLVLLLLTIRGGHFRTFYQSSAGVLVVVVGGLLSLFGGWLVTVLGREAGEQRVLGSAAPVARRPGEVR